MLTCNEKKVLLKPRKAYDLSYLSWIKSGETNNHQTIIKISTYQTIICVSFASALKLRICDAVKWRTLRSSLQRHLSQLASVKTRWHWTLEDENRGWKLMKVIEISWFWSFAQLCTDHLVQLFEPGGSVRVGPVCFEVVVLRRHVEYTWRYTASVSTPGTLRGPFGDPSGRTLRLERVTGCDVTLMEPLERLEAKNFDENPKKIIKILNLHMLYTMKHNIQYTDIE